MHSNTEKGKRAAMESYNNNLLTKPRGNRYAHTLCNIFCLARMLTLLFCTFFCFLFFSCNRNVPTIAVVHCYEPSCAMETGADHSRCNKIGRNRQYRRKHTHTDGEFLFYALVFSRLHVYKDIYPSSVNKIKFQRMHYAFNCTFCSFFFSY